MQKFEADTILSGGITYATLTTKEKDGVTQAIFEIGFVANQKLLGWRPEMGVESIEEYEGFTQLGLSASNDQQRGISRDTIRKLTGVDLPDDWESADGYQRLLDEAPNSLIPGLVGKNVFVKAREYNDKVYWNVYFPREQPKALSLAEFKAKLCAAY